jgi:hypothetical protein
MNRTEKANELIERAKKLGVRVEIDSGLLVAVKQKESGDPETQDSLLAELAKHLRDVRPVVQQRAIDAGANKFLGARILYPEFSLTEVSATEGVLESAHGNGAVTISVTRENFRDPKVPLTARADNLLLIMEKAGGTSSPLNDGPKSEQPRKGIFELFRRSGAGSSVERDRS